MSISMKASNHPGAAGRYGVYLLTILAVILGFTSVDRVALGLVVQNVKLEFHLTDAQIGVLNGIAFAVFYSTFGIPLGRWADRGNRVTIIGLTTALWGVMVVLSGAARSFGELLIIRMGVAVGEAGCLPPAYSLIADYFDRAERPKAVANYFLGGSLSVFFGYFVAGWLNQIYGWRVMFALLGAPGLLLAAIAWLTLKEPRLTRPRSISASDTTAETPGYAEVCRSLWCNRTYRYVLLTFCFNYLFGYGIGQWQPAFFVRSFGLSSGELGTWLAVIYGVGGFAATYLGGHLASRYAPRNERLQLRVLALLNVAFGIISAFAYVSTNAYVALTLIGIAGAGLAMAAPPLFAATQTVVPARMRAISVSIMFLFANLIGMGLGPLLVGVLSDTFRPQLGGESLRYALLAMCPGYLIGCWLLWRAGETVADDTEDEESNKALSEAECGAYEDMGAREGSLQ